MFPAVHPDIDLVLVASAMMLGLSLLPGLPLAMVVRKHQQGWGTLLYDAVVTGLVVVCLVVICLVRIGLYGPGALLAAVALSTIAGALVARATGSTFPELGRPSVSLSTVGAMVVVLGACSLRTAPVNFVFETGDMGSYVNSANVLSRTGELYEGFPHLFTAFLSVPAAFIGPQATVAAVPLLGVLLVLGVFRLAAEVGAPRLVAVAIAAVVGIANIPVWYSLIPVSEAFNAVLILWALVMVARLVERPGPPVVALFFVLGLALGLLRGNALLLVPIAVGAAIPAGLTGGRSSARLRVGAAALFGTGVAVAAVYNIEYLPTYYVGLQLQDFLPSPVFRLAESVGLFHFGLASVLLVFATGGLTWGLGLAAARAGGRVSVRRVGLVLTIVVAVVATVAAIAFGTGELTSGLQQIGMLFIAGAAVSIVLALRSPVVPFVATAAVATALVAVFSALHAYRLPDEQIHHYFQYWDRYLLSEVFPGLVALMVVGAAEVARRLASAERTDSRTAWGAAAAAAVVLTPTIVSTTELSLDQPFLGDPYGDVEALDEATSAPVLPIIWSASDSEIPEGWFFPNTFRAFASPLVSTFDRDVVNIPLDNFASDPVVSPSAAADLMADSDLDEAYLIEDYSGPISFDEQPAPTGLLVERVDTMVFINPILPQVDAPRWRHPAVTMIVYRLSLSE